MHVLAWRLADEMEGENPDAARAAMEQFLRDHELRALRIAELGVRNRDDALDCVQEAMMRLARHYGRKPAAEWKPLFYRILCNQVHDCQRRSTSLWRHLGEQGATEIDTLAAGPGEEPDAIHEWEDSRRVLEKALQDLPLRQQQAFTLRAWEGLSTRETAFAMECSEGSVKTHFHRALSALRAALEDASP